MKRMFSELSIEALRAPARRLRRLRRDNRGVAAVEFALLLPLMVTLYLGSTEITQGVLASRKMAIVSRTLSDIVAQAGTAADPSCSGPGMCDALMTTIFAAATSIMSPFPTALRSDSTPSLTMVVTSIEFKAAGTSPVPTSDKLFNAVEGVFRWSKSAAAPNNTAARACATLAVHVSNSTAPALTNLPEGLYATGPLVVADVTYKYTPTFGGSTLAWMSTGGVNYITMSNTTYMRPRNWTTYIPYVGGGATCTQNSATF